MLWVIPESVRAFQPSLPSHRTVCQAAISRIGSPVANHLSDRIPAVSWLPQLAKRCFSAEDTITFLAPVGASGIWIDLFKIFSAIRTNASAIGGM